MNDLMTDVHVYLSSDLWDARENYENARPTIYFHKDAVLPKGEWYAVTKDSVLYRDSFWTKKQWSLFKKGLKK